MKRVITIGSIVLVLALLFANSPLLQSYVGTLWNATVHHVNNNIPAEFEIARLKDEIKKLDKDVPTLTNALAELSYDLEKDKTDLQGQQGKLKNHTEKLVEFAKAVKNSSNNQVAFANQTLTSNEANKRLAAEYKTFNTMKSIVQGKERLVAAKEKQYKLKLEQVNRIRQQKLEFELQLTNLETELALLKNQPVGSEVAFDSSRITLIEEGLKNLTRQVGIAQKQKEIETYLGTNSDNGQSGVSEQIDPDVVLNAAQGNQSSSVNTTEAVNKE